jgi:hypothetical protein
MPDSSDGAPHTADDTVDRGAAYRARRRGRGICSSCDGAHRAPDDVHLGLPPRHGVKAFGSVLVTENSISVYLELNRKWEMGSDHVIRSADGY